MFQYTKRIPYSGEVVRLSTLVGPFPVDRRDVVRVARRWDMKEDVIAFLRLIPAEEVFNSRTDFVKRVEQVAARIRRSWESTKLLT